MISNIIPKWTGEILFNYLLMFYFRFANDLNMCGGKGGCVYILTNKFNRVLYTGVTSDLYSRIVEHRMKMYPKSFTTKYNCSKLVYYKAFHDIEEAIAEEKRIKGGSRMDKINLIKGMNPNWIDLFPKIEMW